MSEQDNRPSGPLVPPDTVNGISEQPSNHTLESLMILLAQVPGRAFPDQLRIQPLSLGARLEREFGHIVAEMQSDIYRRELGKPLFVPHGANNLRIPNDSEIIRGTEEDVTFADITLQTDAAGSVIEKVGSLLHTHERDYPPSMRDFVGVAIADEAEGSEVVGLIAGSINNHAIFRGTNCTLKFATEDEGIAWADTLDAQLQQLLEPVSTLALSRARGAELRWAEVYGNKSAEEVILDIRYAFAAKVCQEYGFVWFKGNFGEQTLREVDYANPRSIK